MEYILIFKALLSLTIVFAIMFAILKVVQKSTIFGLKNKKASGANNLKISNIVYIDQDTKVVSINSQNGNNYILAIGKHNIQLIDKETPKKEETLND
jgi:hypothetical protein